MSWMKLALAGVAFCATAAVAGAQGAPPAGGLEPGGPQGGPPGGARGARGMQMLFEGITLTANQQSALDSITAKYRAERQNLMPNGREGGPPDDATRAKMMQLMDQQNAEIRALLTADQQKLFDANLEKRKQMMQRPPRGR